MGSIIVSHCPHLPFPHVQPLLSLVFKLCIGLFSAAFCAVPFRRQIMLLPLHWSFCVTPHSHWLLSASGAASQTVALQALVMGRLYTMHHLTPILYGDIYEMLVVKFFRQPFYLVALFLYISVGIFSFNFSRVNINPLDSNL